MRSAAADAGLLEPGLAQRLTRAAGFRNLVAHAYGSLDMRRVHAAAVHGPADLRAFPRAAARSAAVAHAAESGGDGRHVPGCGA